MTATDGLDKTTVTVLQEIIDNFNAVFDNELVFIKKYLFPDVWKFGIAFVKHDNDFASIGIYKIHRGENGILIRKFGQESFNDCTTISCYKSSYKSTSEIIRDQMFRLIDNYFDKAFINPMLLSNVVLEEIAFSFLDAVSSSCDSCSRKDQPYVYFKDVASIEEIEHLWNTLVDYSLETSSYVRMVSNTPEIRVIKMDPLESLRSGYEFEKRRALFDQIYKTSIERRRYGFTLEFEGRFAYNLVHHTIQELRRRKLDFISRVWAPKNYQKSFEELNSMSLSGANRFETGYLLEDFHSNLQKLIRLLPSEYCNTSIELFGRYHQSFLLRKNLLIGIKRTHAAECVYVELSSAEFGISQSNDLSAIDDKSVLNYVSRVYPNNLGFVQTDLWSTFSKPYPLYQNINYLIKKSVYHYFKRELPSPSGFTPVVE